MKENSLRSLPGIPFLLGVLIISVLAVWVFMVALLTLVQFAPVSVDR